MNKKTLFITAYILLALGISMVTFFWLQSNNFQITGLSAYEVFPLLGLLAFITMWTQYMLEAFMNATDTTHKIDTFFAYTSLFVLFCILMHPTILIAKLYADGAGYPPGSYAQYVGENMVWVVGLGTLSLLIFIAFEFRKFFIKHGVWKYVVLLNDVAILAIFYHALRLGSTIQGSVFTTIWYLLGVLLVSALLYKYYYWYKTRGATP